MFELAGRMFDAARTGNMNTLTAYIVAGLNPNVQSNSRDTFLTLAAYNDQPGIVEMLIRVGADVEQTIDCGARPLTRSTSRGGVSPVRLLLAAGADSDAGTPSAPETARCLAARRSRRCRIGMAARGKADMPPEQMSAC
ncbi:ankyrin repeat domain-containing protein [Micrococcus sp. M4NT]|uniref:ankyrin repeat domain-containing protein n=1 Tax=Micrococcus sp. M4NT TaxID=2957501 RepID=UPI0029B0E755|nr:ankyrin repeat domain-containing protein [Micrococcus sp. M4NT]MDX2340765.1 ankyrin repeat domain-containing protein [Micrococcus sp. M4NT]